MSVRYAIYYAPPVDSDLWRLATQWVGRDAAANADLDMPTEIGIDREQLISLTTAPRRYGIHATLKPPMHLKAGCDYAMLVERVSTFCAQQSPVSAGLLQPTLIDGFLALVPVTQSQTLTHFASECVTAFDGLRAPMDTATRAKRIAADLTPRQVELLDAYGYPYIFEFFRMHLTLSNRLEADMHDTLLAAARSWFQPALRAPVIINGLSIYEEAEAGAPFSRVADIPFGRG